MAIYEYDPDVIRWGLHHLDVCIPNDSGCPNTVTEYDKDLSEVAYVDEGYCEPMQANVYNDEIIAHAYQEELSRLAAAETSGSSHAEEEHQQISVLSQDWFGSSRRHCNSECQSNQDDPDEAGMFKLCPSPGRAVVNAEDQPGSPEIEDESALDGEVGRRLNQMFSVPHVPRINGEIPSVDEATSDHQRLLDRLQLYDLVELKVSGDGNCQFRSLSDQIYRTPEHHKFVRQQIVTQLQSHPELYEGYVPMAYDDYLKRITKTGEWGDHVTLQAAADSDVSSFFECDFAFIVTNACHLIQYGVRIFVITSFKDTCYIEILPQIQKSDRIITLSFWAEVHYNSIYPHGEFPELENKKKKRWWWPGG
ncbi:OVARIAN TUMOR DOMAIN-containing deubiquitinating enzyme 9 isoform X3 [Coffea arabica]|uniref:OVARIAN TUMOR DOMAIN-containing deubiquitinating enzyme 9 isoform X3 n=1 Tax=Coffea arabica TaxID=13443 RepID=A0ABM4WSW4_COFAR